MLSKFLRRIQRYIPLIKIAALVAAMASLVYLIFQTAPTLVGLVIFGLLVFLTLAIILSFFLATGRAFLIAVAVAFVLFLKTVDLLSPVNLVLLAVFLLLLGLYLYKR